MCTGSALTSKLTSFNRKDFDTINKSFLHSTPADYSYVAPADISEKTRAEISDTQKLETKRRHLIDKLETAKLRVLEMEVQMGIVHRWTPADKEYREMLQYSRERDYHRAFNTLKKLVVQRLFELQKLNLAGTGE